MKLRHYVKLVPSILILIVSLSFMIGCFFLSESDHQFIVTRTVEVNTQTDPNIVETASWKAEVTKFNNTYYVTVIGKDAYQLSLKLLERSDVSVYVTTVNTDYVKMRFLYDNQVLTALEYLRDLKKKHPNE